MRLLLILLMITMPFQAQNFFEQEDKQLHFMAGNVSGALGYMKSYDKHGDVKRAMITGVCLAFASGIMKEMYDASQGGYIDPEDILATTLGGITINLTLPIFTETKKLYTPRKRRPKSKRKCYKRK